MVTYSISADRAFYILVWRSQETNTRLRKLVRQLIHDFTTALDVPGHVRERATTCCSPRTDESARHMSRRPTRAATPADPTC